MGIIYDPVFGWDFDRMRMIVGWLVFVFLFSGFISVTEGGSFWAPCLYLIGILQGHDVAVLISLIVFSMSTFWWWRREAGW